MRFVTCGVCHNRQTPLNSSLLIDDVVYCEQCLKERFPSDADLKGKKIVREFDPTVCTSCSKDFGDAALRLHGSYPVCEDCLKEIQLRIFPGWVKAFFAGVLGLVLVSLALNWRFIEAYYQIKQSGAVLETGTLEEASTLFASISSNVPEVQELGQMANYYEGLILLQQDKGDEALEAFRGCTDLPDNYGIPILMLQAEIAASYDRKDYPGFVDASKRYLSFDTSSVAFAQVASAYACVYAEQKSDSAKILAMDYLHKAISTRDTTKFFFSYINRIEHRLATGEIIDRENFEARFPNGWSK